MSTKTAKIITANFEVGRFALGPVTAVFLANNLLQALKNYTETFGSLPKAVLPAAAPQVSDVIASLEDMLKQSRQEPPEPPTQN